MSKRTYVPDRGDIVSINFMPAAGREIDKRRPAIVLSPQLYNSKSGFCIVVPLSSQIAQAGRFWLRTPDDLLDRPGVVLCDYLRSVDWRERAASFIKKAPPELIDEITVRVLELVDPVFK